MEKKRIMPIKRVRSAKDMANPSITRIVKSNLNRSGPCTSLKNSEPREKKETRIIGPLNRREYLEQRVKKLPSYIGRTLDWLNRKSTLSDFWVSDKDKHETAAKCLSRNIEMVEFTIKILGEIEDFFENSNWTSDTYAKQNDSEEYDTKFFVCYEMKRERIFMDKITKSQVKPPSPSTRQGMVKKIWEWCKQANYNHTTFHIAAYIFDAISHTRQFSEEPMELQAATSLRIALKMDGCDSTPIPFFLTDPSFRFSRKSVVICEQRILRNLDFHVHPFTCQDFLELCINSGHVSFGSETVKRLISGLASAILIKIQMHQEYSYVNSSNKAKVALLVATESVLFKCRLASNGPYCPFGSRFDKPGVSQMAACTFLVRELLSSNIQMKNGNYSFRRKIAEKMALFSPRNKHLLDKSFSFLN